MDESEYGILTARERDVVENTKKKLAEGRKNLGGIAGTQELLARYDRISRELRGFDSELFIVTTMGMLKAGKSSLVNLLARSPYASPTGFGEDTTLRPALVMQTPEGKPNGEIEVWFKNDITETPGARRKILTEVFDYLREVAPLPQSAYPNSHPLTSEKLRRILCMQHGGTDNEIPKEPLLVVVRVPRDEASLLSKKIVVLDTPGLDSMNSEWTKKTGWYPGLDSMNSEWTKESGWYQWLMEESDLLLFLQSSVAPLNEKAGVVLREIREAKRDIPIWLIQNRMEAKHWQTKTAQNDENDKQRETAVSQFEKFGKIQENYTVNLGKMCSGIFEQSKIDGGESRAEALKEESGFPELEKKIKENLDRNAARQRRRNCAKKVLAEYDATEKSIEAFLETQIRERTEKLKKIEQALEGAYEELENLIEPTKTPPAKRMEKLKAFEISVERIGEFRLCKDDYRKALDQDFPEGSYKVDKLNAFKRKRCEEAERLVRATRLNLKTDDLDWAEEGNGGAKTRLREKIAGKFKAFLGSMPQESWKLLDADGIERGEVGEKISDLDGETGDCYFPDYPSAGRTWWSLGTMEKSRSRDDARNVIETTKYEGKTLEDTLEAYFKSEEEKLRNAVADWANKRLDKLCRSFLEKLEQRKEDKLSELARKREEAETQKERLEEALKILRETKKDFEEKVGI